MNNNFTKRVYRIEDQYMYIEFSKTFKFSINYFFDIGVIIVISHPIFV